MSKANSKGQRKAQKYVEKINNAIWATVKHIVVSLEEEDSDLDLFWTPLKKSFKSHIKGTRGSNVS